MPPTSYHSPFGEDCVSVAGGNLPRPGGVRPVNRRAGPSPSLSPSPSPAAAARCRRRRRVRGRRTQRPHPSAAPCCGPDLLQRRDTSTTRPCTWADTPAVPTGRDPRRAGSEARGSASGWMWCPGRLPGPHGAEQITASPRPAFQPPPPAPCPTSGVPTLSLSSEPSLSRTSLDRRRGPG